MPEALTAAVMFTAVAATLSLLGYLPAIAVVETIPPRRASARAAVWLWGLLLPIAAGAAASVVGLRAALLDPYGSPHLTAGRPHLCSRWLLLAPDAPWSVTLAGVACLGLVVFAVVRLTWGGGRAWRASRRLGAVVEPGAQSVTAPGEAPFVATVGIVRPVTVLTSATEELLTGEELAAVLAHEAAHARRRDGLWDLVGAACVACVLFMPTAHLMLRYLREEAERACDDYAAGHVSAQATASAMTKLAAFADEAAQQRLAAAEGGRWRHGRADVRRRVARLLGGRDEGPDAPAGSPVVGVVLVVLGVGALVLAVIATAPQVRDTLYCMAEALLGVLRGRG